MKKSIMLRRMRKSAFFVIGFVSSMIVLLLAIFAPQIIQYDPLENSVLERLQPPEWLSEGLNGHILGTDNVGRDVFTRLLIGGRESLLIALSVVVIATVLGTLLGLLAGYYGGAIDAVISRLCDVLLAFPSLIFAIVVMSLFGVSTVNLILVIVATNWIKYAKIARNNVLIAKNQEYVSAAKVMHASSWRIMLKEILPNITTPLLIQVSQGAGQVIMLESALSFLNLGIQAPDPSWGNMIATGRSYLATHPWMVFAPGLALMFTVMAFNFLGDGLRDVLDPKRN